MRGGHNGMVGQNKKVNFCCLWCVVIQSTLTSRDLQMAARFCMKLEKMEGRKEENILFNDALNTFYLRLYGVRHGKGPLT